MSLFIMLHFFGCRTNGSKIETMDENSRKHSLQGTWWSDDNQVSALFLVVGDSLYYTDDMESPYFIQLSSDTLTMEQGAFKRRVKVLKLTPDSLILYDSDINENIKLRRR
jgi:hypothetical protein